MKFWFFPLLILFAGCASVTKPSAPTTAFAPESPDSRCKSSQWPERARFGTWELQASVCDDGRGTQIEVWDRRIALGKDLTDLEKQRLAVAQDALTKAIRQKTKPEGETAEDIMNDPMYRRQGLVLPYAVTKYQLVGVNSDSCRDGGGRQVVLVIPKDKAMKWSEVSFATHRLENPEIVFAQWSVDTSVGRFAETRKSGRFTCWIEPPTE